MGGYSASSANVKFAYEQALQAARELYSLAGSVIDKRDAWDTAAGKATDSWVGGHRDTFDNKRSTAYSDGGTIAEGLRTLAKLFAKKWSEARGEQDRINFARYVQAEKDKDGFWENAGEVIVGEDDYGPPPEDPPEPQPPEFIVTRCPLHADYEHQAAQV